MFLPVMICAATISADPAPAAPAPKPKAEAKAYASIRIGLERNAPEVPEGTDPEPPAAEFHGRDWLSRVGLKGSMDLGIGGLKGIGGLEYGFDPTDQYQAYDSNGRLRLRLGYVGLSHKYGTLTFGSQTLVWHSMVRGAFFSDAMDYLRLGTIRDDDQLIYWYNKKMKGHGLAIGASAQFKTGSDQMSVDNLQLGAGYKIGPVKLKVAAMIEMDSEDLAGPAGNSGMLLGARLEFAMGPAKLAAWYHYANAPFDQYQSSRTKVATDWASCMGIYGKFSMKGHTLHAQYARNDRENQGLDDTGAAPSTIKVEYYYLMAKKYKLWLSFENFDGAEIATNFNEIQIGMRFDFST